MALVITVSYRPFSVVVKETLIGARDLGFDSRVGQIGLSTMARNRCDFEDVLLKH